MISKLIYLLIFTLVNLALYSKLNKTGGLGEKYFNWVVGTFLLFSVLHLFNFPFLMSPNDFFPLIFFLAFPVCSYFFFKYRVIKGLDTLRKQGTNEAFLDLGTKIFSFFFLKLSFAMAFVTQCALILNPPT